MMMKKKILFISSLALLILALPSMGQLKNRVVDSGTAIEMGSMVKLNSSGQILVCGDSDTSVAGIVVAVLPEGGTDYYLIASSDIFPARLEAGVLAGDRLTTSASGKLKKASIGDVTIGFALENGHATDLRKTIISLDYPISVDWDTLSAYYDILDLQTSGDAEVHWDNLSNLPADLADGDDLGFQQLRANGSAWLPDSVTLVDGTGITLTQTGNSITIAAAGGGADTDWSGAATGQMYATDSGDSVGIGTATPSEKLDVNGNVIADMFRDRNNTSFWLDPAGSSNLQSITINGGIALGGITHIRWIWRRSLNYVYPYNTTDSVGIGTISPSEKLDVIGNIRASGLVIVDSITSPTDTLYLPDKVWMDELVTDSIEARGSTVKIRDGLVITDVPDDAAGDTILTLSGNQVKKVLASSLGDGDWIYNVSDGADTTLMTGGAWGIARSGATLYGNADSTHVNLGVACTTGASGQNQKYCTVGGGAWNAASGRESTVGGGSTNEASGNFTTVSGGTGNTATANFATVSGGQGNDALDIYTYVGGGVNNTANGNRAVVTGGEANSATGQFSVIAGGKLNCASGDYSAIPGGYADSVSGGYSFAFGNRVVVPTDYTSQFNSSYYKGILRAYGNLEFSDTLLGGIGTADSFRIFDDGDTTRFDADNPIKIGDASLIIETDGDIYATQELHIGDVPDDATGDSVLTIDGGQVKKVAINDVSTAGISAFKIHQTDSLSPVENIWTSFEMSAIVASETIDSAFTWPATTGLDSLIKVNETGFYQFGGCIHIMNPSTGALSNVSIYSRIYVNGTDEARCSQRDMTIDIPKHYRYVLDYTGTVYLEADDILTLQYYVNEDKLVFFSAAAFDNQVAATLWLIKLK